MYYDHLSLYMFCLRALPNFADVNLLNDLTREILEELSTSLPSDGSN